MNLWLSPHGIWYYRKVTTLPCGRRKEIKKSLHTRDKLTARAAVAKPWLLLVRQHLGLWSGGVRLMAA